MLLHELKHILFAIEGIRPNQRLEEEIACDVWARSFMTDKIAGSAGATGQSYRLLLQKRAMGLALGAAILHDITPEFGRFGSKDYPPIADRIHSMITGINLDEDSYHWLFSACLLIGIHRTAGIKLPMVITNPKTFVANLIDQLN